MFGLLNKFLLFISLLSCFYCLGQESRNSLIRFTENKSQWEEGILMRASLDGGALFLRKNGLTYHFYDKDTYRSMHAKAKTKLKQVKTSWFHVEFPGSSADPILKKKKISRDYCNFFIGNKPEHWASKVYHYSETVYENLWQGIDMELLGKENSIKYNFYVKPGIDPSIVKLEYKGLKNISLSINELSLQTNIGEITEHKPYAYQVIAGKQIEVPCRFKLNGSTVSFEFPNKYNPAYELVIDPVLVFACSSGSTADNFGMTATYDNDGNLYSGGTVFNIGFPVVNAYDPTFNSVVQYGQTDIVITKYDSSGAFLQYSTYIGGAFDTEVVNSLITDAQDNLYIYGATSSSDFPVSVGAYDPSFNGGKHIRFYRNGAFFEHGTDIFVFKLSNGGNLMLGSTFVGGSGNDGLNCNKDSIFVGSIFPYGNVYEPIYDSLFFNYGDQNRGEIQLDASNNIVIASSTHSTDFPFVNGFDNSLGGFQDAVVFKLSNNLSSLMWSTYMGGSKNDAGYALFLDALDNVFVTGGTCSSDFGATTGAYQPNYIGGKADAYIAKISSNGNQLLRATYYGTSNYDQSFFVQLDNSSNVYIFGQTQGTLPVINATYSNTNGRQFVAKIDSTLSTLLYQTKIGNGTVQINISPSAFLVDCAENVYLSGWGGNILTGVPTTNMPITSNAQQSSTDGFNFYLMVLAKNAASLVYGSYFGGPTSAEHVDGGTSRFDKKGIIYQSVCAGCGGNDDFPVTPGAWPTTIYGNNWNQSTNCNNGTFKFDFQIAQASAQFTTSSVSGCSPFVVTFNNLSNPGSAYVWDFGNNDTTSVVFNPTRTFTNPGTYTVNLYIEDSSTCNIYDTAQLTITVFPKPVADFSDTIVPCGMTYNFYDFSTITSGTTSPFWDFGDLTTSSLSNPTHGYAQNGTYSVTLITISDNGCKDTLIKPVSLILNPDSVAIGDTVCPGSSIMLQAYGGSTYQWFPSTTLSNSFISNPIASPVATTLYSVIISENDAQGNACIDTLQVPVIVHPPITANFNYSVNACGNTINFSDSSYQNPVAWSWDFGDGTFSNLQQPAHSFAAPGTYSVSLLVNNSNGCRDSLEIPISVGGFNPIGINAPVTICYGNTVQLSANGGIAYTWSPSTSLSNAFVSNPIASPTVSTTYTCNITTVNSTGDTCVSSLSTSVNIASLSSSQQQLNANPDTIYLGDNTQLSSTLGLPYSISWTPSQTLNNSSLFNPIATPLHTTTYTAIAQDINGCNYLLDTITVYVIANKCEEAMVFVPNTFTPNDDGQNDILFVRSNFIVELYFAVYNRWGEKVFETSDITKGWDGFYKNKKADPGVFGYYLRFRCNNEEESFKKGNVTLIR